MRQRDDFWPVPAPFLNGLGDIDCFFTQMLGLRVTVDYQLQLQSRQRIQQWFTQGQRAFRSRLQTPDLPVSG